MTAFLSTAQARKHGLAKQHKYRAEAVTVDGIRFDSKAEARRYGDLKSMEKAGEIEQLEIHLAFDLNVRRTLDNSGSYVCIGRYESDFYYFHKPSQSYVVEDVKGFMTPLAKRSIAHFEAQYGIKVRIVK